MKQFRTLPFKYTKDITETLNINEKSVYNLSNSGRLKAKKTGGKLYFCNNSLNDFISYKNSSNFITAKDAKKMLKTNDIEDKFYILGKTKNQAKIKRRNGCNITYYYGRYTEDFPISLKQLCLNGYIKKDPDITPALYEKQSVINAIKVLKDKHTNELINEKCTDEENILLGKKLNKWKKEKMKAFKDKITFNTPKPTLSTQEIEQIRLKVIDSMNNPATPKRVSKKKKRRKGITRLPRR